MSFHLSPPSIPLEAISWEVTGGTKDPKARLLGHVRIAGLDMHLEAWEVITEDGEMRASEASLWGAELEALQEMMGCAFTSTTIDGREYVLIATPYGR